MRTAIAEAQDGVLVRAAGALIQYLTEIRPSGATHLRPVRIRRPGHVMLLDEMTRRNLELVEPLRGGEEGGTLLDELSLRAPGPIEWAAGGIGTHRFAPSERPVSDPRGVVRPRRAHPLAVLVLVLGLACLVLGAILIILSGVFGHG